ncbi:hypothetical protein BDW75DRAFT_200354 [Aspergillus navahoensis]
MDGLHSTIQQPHQPNYMLEALPQFRKPQWVGSNRRFRAAVYSVSFLGPELHSRYDVSD